MPSVSPHGGGDGGKAARRSLLQRPSTTVRLDATTHAIAHLLAARRAVSLNSIIETAVVELIDREINKLREASNGKV